MFKALRIFGKPAPQDEPEQIFPRLFKQPAKTPAKNFPETPEAEQAWLQQIAYKKAWELAAAKIFKIKFPEKNDPNARCLVTVRNLDPGAESDEMQMQVVKFVQQKHSDYIGHLRKQGRLQEAQQTRNEELLIVFGANASEIDPKDLQKSIQKARLSRRSSLRKISGNLKKERNGL